MARTRVARTRLTDSEYDEFVAEAALAGISPGEHLRNLIVSASRGFKDLASRVTSVEDRLRRVESDVLVMKEGLSGR